MKTVVVINEPNNANPKKDFRNKINNFKCSITPWCVQKISLWEQENINQQNR